MDMKTDEDEHSIEMHLPYVAKIMEDFKDNFTIIPVMWWVLKFVNVLRVRDSKTNNFSDIFNFHNLKNAMLMLFLWASMNFFLN